MIRNWRYLTLLHLSLKALFAHILSPETHLLHSKKHFLSWRAKSQKRPSALNNYKNKKASESIFKMLYYGILADISVTLLRQLRVFIFPPLQEHYTFGIQTTSKNKRIFITIGREFFHSTFYNVFRYFTAVFVRFNLFLKNAGT